MDDLIALLFGLSVAYYFFSKGTFSLIVWGLIGYLFSLNCIHRSRTVSVVVGVFVSLVVMYFSTREGFEEEKLSEKEKEKDSEPQATGKSVHADLGTTILHAYRNLSPEQIGGMRRDTKELMELQKELMGTLSEMKPAIEQGAELLGTFSQFFGKPASP
jgi:uncharacterized membrane protein